MGQIDPENVKQVFEKINEKDKEKRKRKSRKPDTNHEDETPQEVQLFLSPIRVIVQSVEGVKRTGKREENNLIWIPVSMDREGRLSMIEKSPPFIPRELLTPALDDRATIGSIEAVDQFLNQHRLPTPDQGWESYWRYCSDFFRMVTGQEWDQFQMEGYESLPNGYLLLETDFSRAVFHLLGIYDHLLDQQHYSPLLHRYTQKDKREKRPLLSPLEEREEAKKHVGQMGGLFPLSPSQRETLHHYLSLDQGEILAVNGPPGTGKTTLLHSVVANRWVKAAFHQQEPPVIFAVSANNQAVTNIIDSFGKIDDPNPTSPLSGRWLPCLSSYGTYCASASKKEEAQNYHYLFGDWTGTILAWEQDDDYLREAEAYFLECCRKYASRSISDLTDAVSYLHQEICRTVSEMEEAHSRFHKWSVVKEEVTQHFDSIDSLKKERLHLEEKVRLAEEQVNQARKQRDAWLEHVDREPWWMSLFSFFPPVRERIRVRNLRFLEEESSVLGIDAGHTEEVTSHYQSRWKETKQQAESLRQRLQSLSRLERDWIKKEKDWKAWLADKGTTPDNWTGWLDQNLRFRAFQLATHYWEAKWLLEVTERKKKGVPVGSEECCSAESLRQLWRRLAKLTPCFVSTFYMIPRFFRTWDESKRYVSEGIDLLLVDEAGQAVPEISGGAFALAKQALVVGDRLQIEPISNIPHTLDAVNLLKHRLIQNVDDYESLTLTDLCSPTGSVMGIAQRLSIYQKFEEMPGMYLSEHRRCVPEIIAYCNELAYKERLEPLRENDLEDFWLPHIGYRVVSGDESVRYGSRGNEVEAKEVAQWIFHERKRLEAYYKDSIEQIVGVVTPFRWQKHLIMRHLRQMGISKLTVGTVHALQGAERRVILFSPVYTSNKQGFFFDRNKNMLNVAVSRAKDSFLVFGSVDKWNPKDTSKPSGLLVRYLFADEKNRLDWLMV